ncbi:hypothetical protein ACFV0H_22115 [Streptomyces erythrochromogenes]|uniref:Uncharacterized protein n=1 Tax=Streptomyces erythrochromogenes TaxID=285574 RepID=A0ABZ1QFN0_9ACTN|nr:hypothetical protein [Streptomyces erythrochromogenes]MCX5586779.1 hypothetical protein [Streptomyces erythrochromogenes]
MPVPLPRALSRAPDELAQRVGDQAVPVGAGVLVDQRGAGAVL